MPLIKNLVITLLLVIISGCANINLYTKENGVLPTDFVFLADVDPSIIQSLRYHTDQNFLGRQVAGYKSGKVVCTRKAALQLKKANDFLKKHGYRFVIYDAYRPVMAVRDFNHWGKDTNDDKAKEYYYPYLSKKDIFRLGFVAARGSSHSRGSTFDLTIIRSDQDLKPIVYSKRRLASGEEIPFLDDNTVDMGSSWDLFHEVSNHDSRMVTEEQNKMRNFLRTVMKQHGFRPCRNEWWHYTLQHEPYYNTYFNFIVE